MPGHAYVPAAPGCWSVFTVVQAEELQRWGRAPAHGMVVDAYLAQHPGDGAAGPRARRSPVIHLIGLCARLEHDFSDAAVGPLLQHSAERLRREQVPALSPRSEPGERTVSDLVEAMQVGADAEDYGACARAWAEEVWRTWAHEHDRIRRLYRLAWLH
jgi:hypothetical protein